MTDKLLIEALEKARKFLGHMGGPVDFIDEALAAHRSQQEAAQEPVAWGYLSGKEWRITTDPQMVEAMAQASGLKVRPLYTAPAPSESAARKPMTRSQIAKALADAGLKAEDYPDDMLIEPLVWAIEAAHGITDAALSASGQKGEPT